MGSYRRFGYTVLVVGMLLTLDPRASSNPGAQPTSSEGPGTQYLHTFTGSATLRGSEIKCDIPQFAKETSSDRQALLNVLGWIWIDKPTYLTRQMPKEPMFSVVQSVGRIAFVPLAVLQSSSGGCIPLAEMQTIFDKAGQPQKFILMQAKSRHFEGGREEIFAPLKEALEWVTMVP